MNHHDTISPEIRKFISTGFDVVTVPGPGLQNFSINAYPGKNGEREAVFEEVADFIKEKNAKVVMQRVFGGDATQFDGVGVLGQSGAHIDWPVTSLRGNRVGAGALNDSHVYAISGSSVTPVRLDGRVMGGVFEDEDARYCLLGDVRPSDPSASRFQQALSVFETIESAVELAGMGVSRIVRTWFYNDRILDWYGEFNKARTRFFLDHGIFDGLVPASTGIGVANAAGAALVADVLAMEPKNDQVRIRNVPSPLQCPATNYKSSFSRAVEISVRGQRRLYISGTASIAPDGSTAYIGNVEKQIGLTMEVLHNILASRRMGWSDITRGIAYFKDVSDKPLLDVYCRKNQLPYLPVAVSSADICRDDLLFEVEVDAVAYG